MGTRRGAGSPVGAVGCAAMMLRNQGNEITSVKVDIIANFPVPGWNCGAERLLISVSDRMLAVETCPLISQL